MATKIKNVNFFILFSFLFTININAQYNQKTGMPQPLYDHVISLSS